MDTRKPLSFPQQLAYASGMLGWGMMISLISVILLYMYAPTSDSGIPILITQATFFGIFNIIALITSGGRLVDAIYDPFIAQLSDRSENPRGRRTPIMKRAILPSLLFCVLVFCPIYKEESTTNVVWLAVALVLFYISTTSYIIPYTALLPELAHTSEEKVKLATWQSVGYVFGVGFASTAFNVAAQFQDSFQISKVESLQWTVFLFAGVAALFMYITVLAIDERKLCVGEPSAIPLRGALRQALTNRNFLVFIVADFSFFVAVTIITSGLLYFVTILLGLPEGIGSYLMITMVLVSLIFYPVVNVVAKKIGKKPIVVFSLALLSVIFLGIYSLGTWHLAPEVQIYSLIALAAIPFAALNILPNAIIAEIIEKDKQETGESKEAIYFAVRYFFVKIAQVIGIALFAMLLIYGKDRGDDFGIRMNGLLGCVLCAVGAIVFMRFRERPAVQSDDRIDDAKVN